MPLGPDEVPTQSLDFRPRSEIWLMQTLLLITVFGKLCSSAFKRLRLLSVS